MTNIEAAKLEKFIVAQTGTLDAVALLMANSDSLWHDLMHGIDGNITDEKILDKIEKILDKIDRSKFILSGGEYCKEKNAKCRALKRIANFFNILADVFKAIEDSVDRRTK
jgi:hypothetical protein